MTAYADPVAQAEVERLTARVAELEAREQRVRDSVHDFACGKYRGPRSGWAIRELYAALDGTQP